MTELSAPPTQPLTEDVLRVRGLTVEVGTSTGRTPIVEDVDLRVGRGRTLGVVGESGSGKSITSLAVMGLLPRGVEVTTGSIEFDGRNLVGLPRRELVGIRGRQIAMIFQEPIGSLNPAFRVGEQIAESVRRHQGLGRRPAWERAVELLDMVGIPSPRSRAEDYPHRFSGGMAQRAMIAIAIACDPTLLIADEPTTALDVTTQMQILELLMSLRDELDMSLMLVSHDFGVVASVADAVTVMFAGQVVERASAARMFAQPEHPYTDALLDAHPDATPKGTHLPVIPGAPPPLRERPTGCRFHPRCAHAEPRCAQTVPGWTVVDVQSGTRCLRHGEIVLQGVRQDSEVDDSQARELGGSLLEVRGLRKTFDVKGGVFGRTVRQVHAVDGVDLDIRSGETLGLVGESGSGKSTVGRLVLRLLDPTGGAVRFDGEDLAHSRGRRLREARRQMQMVFQDPYASLDPRMTVGQSVAEPLVTHSRGSAAEHDETVAALFERVGLDPRHRHRMPNALSGGQRQRVAIARALALSPKLIVCDEPVSALDLSTQSQVVNLLKELQQDLGIALLFIAHDLSVVHHISDRIAVMYRGRIVETGPAEEVYRRPSHPYTKLLLSAVLSPDPSVVHELQGGGGAEVGEPIEARSGCRFRDRCPEAIEECAAIDPELVDLPGGVRSACIRHDQDPHIEEANAHDDRRTP